MPRVPNDRPGGPRTALVTLPAARFTRPCAYPVLRARHGLMAEALSSDQPHLESTDTATDNQTRHRFLKYAFATAALHSLNFLTAASSHGAPTVTASQSDRHPRVHSTARTACPWLLPRLRFRTPRHQAGIPPAATTLPHPGCHLSQREPTRPWRSATRPAARCTSLVQQLPNRTWRHHPQPQRDCTNEPPWGSPPTCAGLRCTCLPPR